MNGHINFNSLTTLLREGGVSQSGQDRDPAAHRCLFNFPLLSISFDTYAHNTLSGGLLVAFKGAAIMHASEIFMIVHRPQLYEIFSPTLSEKTDEWQKKKKRKKKRKKEK